MTINQLPKNYNNISSNQGDEDIAYKGTVIYKCITKDLLDGFWSGNNGNPLYLGEERCYKVESEQLELMN
jgi:hypothetical protein